MLRYCTSVNNKYALERCSWTARRGVISIAPVAAAAAAAATAAATVMTTTHGYTQTVNRERRR